jgi:metallo-beta-lactamase family protein
VRRSFRGADRSVTGSRHMLGCAALRGLIDCGMIQNSRDLHEDNAAADFGFDPATIEILLLTYAYLDHCGRLPLRGFRGEVVTTTAARDLARLVLLDAARVQEEDAKRRQRQARRRCREADKGPLFSLLDALDSLDRFGEHGEALDLAPGWR